MPLTANCLRDRRISALEGLEARLMAAMMKALEERISRLMTEQLGPFLDGLQAQVWRRSELFKRVEYARRPLSARASHEVKHLVLMGHCV